MLFYSCARFLTVAARALLLATTTVATSSNQPQQQVPMMASSPITLANLRVHIEPDSAPSTIQITISNTHKQIPLTILTWDAPFDRISLDTGVYHVQPTTPGADELKSPGVKIKRMVPAPRTSLLEIPANGKVTRQLSIKSRWIPTDGDTYKVWAKGPWRAVWTKAIDEVTDDDLASISGDFDIEARYETNEITLKLLQ